jgi:hypothetical protein
VIVAVSTVRDTVAHVRRYVEGNLRGGVDQLVVLLDAPDAEVEGYLATVPQVVHVVTDEAWWSGERPADLNVRQRVNANLVKAVATLVPGIEWVFHIDGDEVAWIDRDVLAAVPADRVAVRLTPLEAVARRRWEGEPTLFKRPGTPEELAVLHERGAIATPTNSAYFHGHPFGKAGVRPALDLWLRLHDVVDAHGERVAAYSRPGLRMLHYESYDSRDFVRKWTALLGSGGAVSFRADRQPTADAVRAVLGRRLDPAATEAALLEVFDERVADDVSLLRELGLVVEADPAGWTRRPEPDDGSAASLRTLLAAAAAEPKRTYHPGTPAVVVADQLERLERRAGRGAVRAGRRWWRRS